VSSYFAIMIVSVRAVVGITMRMRIRRGEEGRMRRRGVGVGEREGVEVGVEGRRR
jgi:hypothetical protein